MLILFLITFTKCIQASEFIAFMPYHKIVVRVNMLYVLAHIMGNFVLASKNHIILSSINV
uniref:Uncharacterized protein n=1 Tax=Nelumbo nucifera TaxID=4432 RepID=A0A822YF87_NELNU|nr:TPA_asm: hypothetical protein HUJ06_010008 [Nelumbo nucifera]